MKFTGRPWNYNFIPVDSQPKVVARNNSSVLRRTSRLLFIVPRTKEKLFEESEYEKLQNILDGYVPELEPWDPFRVFEGRFYVDIATDQGGRYQARRRLSAVLLDPSDKPVKNKPVEWRLLSGSSDLRFLDSAGNEKNELTGDAAPKTDDKGVAEVVIAHPAKAPAARGDRRLRIQVREGSLEAEIFLTITRNDDVPSLDDVSRKDRTLADHIYVYEPDAVERSAPNDGVRDLQEALNEVVSRHRAIQPYTWIEGDGEYADSTRDAVRHYLTRFTGVTGADYPYNLSRIGLSPGLSDYLRVEYAPFDPSAAASRGWIVDRRILIGDRWDKAETQIDGLLELKEGVVDVLKGEMVRTANEYTGEGTFWLHRTIHQPYTQVAGFVFRVTAASVTPKTAASPTAPNLLQPDGSPVTLSQGELYPSPAAAGAWVQIQHAAGNGWVPNGSGRRVHDDQSIAGNAGTHGGDGVAYSWGNKDLPDRYRNFLETNPDAPPADGAGSHLRIASWEEYATGHRVGRTQAEGANPPETTGCDCSGFVQNCVTYALFPSGTRIVPEAVTPRVNIRTSRWALNEIAAGGFVGAAAHARPITGYAATVEKNWLRQGDIVSSAGHIVWIAEAVPNIATNAFAVYNEYGNFQYSLLTGATAPLDTTRFLRKALRMPLHYWIGNNALAGYNIGKVYIWA